MATSIRGLSVAIESPTTQFKKAMNEMTSAARSSKQELKALQKSLDLEFDDESFAHAQEVAQRTLDQTSLNVETLRQRLQHLKESGQENSTEFSDLSAKLEQQKSAFKEARIEAERLQSLRFNDITASATQARTEFEKLKENLNIKFDESDFVKAQETATAAISETQKASETLREKMQELEKAGKTDTAEYTALKTKFEEVQKSAEDLRNSTAELNNIKFDALQKHASVTKSHLDSLQKSLDLKFNKKTLIEAQKATRDAIVATDAAASALRNRMKALEDAGKIDTDEYKELKTLLQNNRNEAEEFHKSLKSLNNARLDRIANQVKAVGDKISGVGKALTPVSALAGATITGLGALGTKAIKAADDVATLATQYGMSAESLQKFNYVALQTDTSADDLYKAFVKVRSGVSDLATGAKSTASEALKKLNLGFSLFDGSEEQFYKIIAALSDMENQTKMVSVANDVFGEVLANKILPLIYAGTDAVQSYCEEYDELGALTNEQVSALAEFDNVLNKLKTQFQNVFLQIGSSLLPIMERLATLVSEKLVPKLQALAEWFNSLSLSQQEFTLKAALVVAALAPVLTVIGKLTSGVGSLIGMIPKLGTALSGLAAHPIIAIIAVVAGILVLLYTKCEAFRESINNLVTTLGEALQPILGIIMNLFGTLMEMLEPLIQTLGDTLSVIIDLLVVALQPLFDNLSFLFNLLQPLIKITLIPLRVALKNLERPLKVIGALFKGLGAIISWFQELTHGVFVVIVDFVNGILSEIETGINKVIKWVNGIIDDINNALGWLGVNIGHIGDVTLHIKTSAEKKADGMISGAASPEMPDDDDNDEFVYDKIGAGGTSGDVYNNDYSTNTKTQNVTVTIQNYAAEVDVDNLVREINIKLAEAM